ncbi:MAG: hypothetical protein ACFHX7_06405 [Pseudomonadota bacterium]
MFRTILTVALISLVSSVQAKVIQVLPGHNTLQPAIDQLVNGDTLVLVDGTYTHDSTITLSVSATIRSISPGIRPRIVRVGTGNVLFIDGAASAVVVQGLKFSSSISSSAAQCTFHSRAVELRMIDNIVECGLIIDVGENVVVVGNSFLDNGSITISNPGQSLFAGNTIQRGTSGFNLNGGSLSTAYVIGNQFSCTSFINQATNGKSCTMLSLGNNGTRYVVANRFMHDVDGVTAFDANDSVRAIHSTSSGKRFIYNNLIEFKDGDEYFSPAGIVQGIGVTGSSVNDIANNLVIYKGGMPEPTKGDAAIYVEGVGRATNNMVVGYAGTALASNDDILEFVYNLCSGVGDLGLCTPDKNNLSVAPQFAEEVDYTLAGGSPAVNGGDPGLHLSDLDGTRSDIGLHGGRFGFLQFDQQRAASDKPYIYPLFDEINLSNLNAVEVKAVSVARFK